MLCFHFSWFQDVFDFPFHVFFELTVKHLGTTPDSSLSLLLAWHWPILMVLLPQWLPPSSKPLSSFALSLTLWHLPFAPQHSILNPVASRILSKCVSHGFPSHLMFKPKSLLNYKAHRIFFHVTSQLHFLPLFLVLFSTPATLASLSFRNILSTVLFEGNLHSLSFPFP